MACCKMDKLYDVIVVGGGPAGLTAALYLARARYRVLVVEKETFGGQITITAEVVNYPGIARASGSSLTETMRRQAQSFGAEFLLAEAEGLELEGDIKTVTTGRGTFQAFGLVLATGAHPRMVGFRGEAEFKGHGVAYCATCDGEFFTGLEVFVVGGGFAAAEEAVFLTKYARHVTVLVRKGEFRCAKSVSEAVLSHPKITVKFFTELQEVQGDESLNYARLKNVQTGEITEYRPPAGETFGVFVFAGYEPATELVQGKLELDQKGYIVTDRNQRTSREGVYAAGDVCIKNLRQAVTAAADGAVAATELERYAAAMQKKTGRIPSIPAVPVKEAETAVPAGGNAAGVQEEETGGELFSAEMKAQLAGVFAKMARPLLLKAALDEGSASRELTFYLEELCALTDKLSFQRFSPEEERAEAARPCVRLFRADGSDSGLAFHGVPGGHEFNSFVLSLYNAAGPGQTLEEDLLEEIQRIRRPVDLKVLVSLSCTMCPELVMAAQRLAAASPFVRAEVYDLNHFPQLRERYKVMSVPCLVIDDTKISFGKKNLRQLLQLL